MPFTTEAGTFLDEASFRIHSPAELSAMSVTEIRNPESFTSLGHPTPDGLYSTALGPDESSESCATCHMGKIDCPGHFGHIRLPLPVFHPLLFEQMYEILLGICNHCGRLHADRRAVNCTVFQFRALKEYGDAELVERLSAMLTEHLTDKKEEKISASEMATVFEEWNKGAEKVSHRNVHRRRQIGPYLQRVSRSFVLNHMRRRGLKCKACGLITFKFVQELKCRIVMKPPSSWGSADVDSPHVNKRRRKNVGKTDAALEDEDDLDLESERKVINEDVFNHSLNKLVTPTLARQMLRDVWRTDAELLSTLYPFLNSYSSRETPVDAFFLEILAVPPVRFRPLNVVHGRKVENAQSSNLSEVLRESRAIDGLVTEMKACQLSEEAMEEEGEQGRDKQLRASFRARWATLQTNVNSVYDSALDKRTATPRPGVKQLLEKKSGLFRMNLMGKRVDYSARSVISPDPFIAVDEIGIPFDFAKKLTFREPVTQHNVEKLRRQVVNGPEVHPGATHVEIVTPRGVSKTFALQRGFRHKVDRTAEALKLLTPTSAEDDDDELFGGNKFVHRHVENGDVLLLNRQPTLHRPSVMAHRARLLPRERTLRLHYANCKSYNADFDGDEMNAHLPQDQLGRAEALNLVSTDRHYLVPKDGTPLTGLIQDHIVAGVHLTVRGKFFEKEQFHQLINMALLGFKARFKLVPPAILKPIPMWSGKQIISTLLLNIIPTGKPLLTLTSKSKVGGANWRSREKRAYVAGGTPLGDDEMAENQVIFRKGELLCGVLDKGQYGATAYGLVHTCYELYGGKVSTLLLTALARLFTVFLQNHGFTLGIADIVCTKDGDDARKTAAAEAWAAGPKAIKEFFDRKGEESDLFLSSDLPTRIRTAMFSSAAVGEVVAEMDHAMKGVTDSVNNAVTRAIIPKGLVMKFPRNNLQLMIQTGAKGSSVNALQISALLGQIELEGKRPPLMVSGRTLPSFLPFDVTPRAGGFIDGRFLTGIKPQEYFFHCMAGREGLVDTAVKTSRSGYLQRCLIKHMEGLAVAYDATVRDASDGSLVQFSFGEDGVDILKTPYLNPRQFSFLVDNYDETAVAEEVSQMKESPHFAVSHDRKADWRERVEIVKKSKQPKRFSAFLRFAALNRKKRPTMTKEELTKSWNELEPEIRDAFKARVKNMPAPLDESLRPDIYYGILREKLETEVETFVSGLKNDINFHDLIASKAMKSYVQPGEPVGLLAAQSIGEPSTQMTLNTFHFAGRGEMNVTLGIPRLREILIVASKEIRTPTMEAPFKPEVDATRRDLLRRRMNKVVLSEVVESVDVDESIVEERSLRRKSRHYKIRVTLSDPSQYEDKTLIGPPQILRFLERVFFPNLLEIILAKFDEINNRGLLNASKLKNPRLTREAVDDLDLGAHNLGGMQDSDNEDADEGKGLSTRKKRLREDYGGEEEERIETVGKEEDAEVEEENEDTEESQPEDEDDDGAMGQPESKRSKPQSQRTATKISPTWLMERYSSIRSYEEDLKSVEIIYATDVNQPRLDLGEIIKTEVARSVVHRVRGISRGFVSEDKKTGVTVLRTEGINIEEFARNEQFIDMSRFYTNDVNAMAQFFGVDAARRVLVREIKNVFSVYGITVDPRHLSLISDYMTFEGGYKPLNRLGIVSNSSPLQKATFETSMQFLKSAVVSGAKDDMESPSSRLVTGRLVRSGTGCFDVRTNVVKAAANLNQLNSRLKEMECF